MVLMDPGSLVVAGGCMRKLARSCLRQPPSAKGSHPRAHHTPHGTSHMQVVGWSLPQVMALRHGMGW